VAIGTWVAQHLSARRNRRRATIAAATRLGEIGAAVEAQAAADAGWQRRIAPDVGTALERIARRAPQLWERRPAHGDAWHVVLGRGERAWTPRLADEPDPGDVDVAAVLTQRVALTDVPVTTALAPGTVLGIAGSAAAASARSLLVQLAANCGPAD